jgi:hypothetical protein
VVRHVSLCTRVRSSHWRGCSIIGKFLPQRKPQADRIRISDKPAKGGLIADVLGFWSKKGGLTSDRWQAGGRAPLACKFLGIPPALVCKACARAVFGERALEILLSVFRLMHNLPKDRQQNRRFCRRRSGGVSYRSAAKRGCISRRRARRPGTSTRPLCFTIAQEGTGQYGSIPNPLVKHFASNISAIGRNDHNVRYRG